MSSAHKTALRLIGALEDFAEREAVLLRAGDFSGFAAVRRRETPLIVRLGELGAAAATRIPAKRLEALVERRRRILSILNDRRGFLISERQRLAEKRERLQLVGPYARFSALRRSRNPAAGGRSRLNAAV